MRPEVGPVLLVRGADLMDGTPIYDIKPYIPYADCHPDAAEGFTGQTRRHLLEVSCPEELWAAVPQADRDALRGGLANDPRPPTSTTLRGSTSWSSAGWKCTLL